MSLVENLASPTKTLFSYNVEQGSDLHITFESILLVSERNLRHNVN